MSVLTLADAKTHLNVVGTTYDTELQTFIDAAEAAIAVKVGPLSSTATTRRVRGGGCALVLPVLPAVSLTSVTPVGSSALTLSDLYLDTTSGMVRYDLFDLVFTQPWYTVVYQAGWATLPGSLLLAVKEQVRHLWETQRGGAGADKPGSFPSEAPMGMGYSLPNRVLELLSPYMGLGFA